MNGLQNPMLPPTVVDQIRLWEVEKNRLRAEEGYLYEDFKSTQDYELVRNYAQQLGVVVWDGPPGMRKFFVTPEGHQIVRCVCVCGSVRGLPIDHARFSEFIKRRLANTPEQ
jgi:hypothetical protein